MVEDLVKKISFLNPKSLATAYDGTSRAYTSKNLFESFMLSLGINLVSCDSSTPSMMSSSLKELDVDYGVFFLENNYMVFDKKGLPMMELPSLSSEYEIKRWNEIGILERVEISKFYRRKIEDFFDLKTKRLGHIVVNLNFSPLSKVVPYILRNISLRLTTLQASEEETLREDFERSVETTRLAMNAYKAELAFVIDRIGETIRLLNDEKDFLKKACSFILKKDEKIKEILFLGEHYFEFDGVKSRRIKKEDLRFDESTLIVDTSKNSIIYPKISWWFDSFITFLSWYSDNFLYK